MTAASPYRSMAFVLLVSGASLVPLTAPAQRAAGAQGVPAAPGRDQSRFITEARDGTRRYLSRQHAIDDGFTRVGVEFPAMGEHWVNLARVLEDSFDAKRPSILIYTNTGEGPRLAGVAYSKLLRGRQTPPAFPSAGAWHEHSGTIAEASLPLSHATPVTAGTGRDRSAEDDAPRFFVLHAWVWTDNPDGTFVTDNWTLPQQRLGLATAGRLDRPVVRAMALAEDEDEYYRLVLRTLLSLSEREELAVARVIDAHRARAKRALASVRAKNGLGARDASELRAVWDALWTGLEGVLPRRVRELREAREQM